jgi:hypothetical protein
MVGGGYYALIMRLLLPHIGKTKKLELNRPGFAGDIGR